VQGIDSVDAITKIRNILAASFAQGDDVKDFECRLKRFHFGASKGRGGRRYRPYAFTELGVAMLSSVLNSERAVNVNIEIMRAFVRLRQLLATHADLARKLESLEKKYDGQFRAVFEAIRQLMIPPPDTRRGRIGFQPPPQD
jgi:hypothetical protein